MTRKWKARVAWHMIMKNEETVLDRCLSSMKGCWDDGRLFITDTGSTDKSVEIAQKHGAHVSNFEWIDDFGAARNFSLNQVYEKLGDDIDYIGWCDCDDVLMSENDVIKFREVLDSFLDDPNVHCLNFPYIYSHSHDEVGNQSIAEFKYHRLRVFKPHTAKWKARIHEYLESDQRKHFNCQDVDFHHFREGTGVFNTARNLRILKKVVDEATPEEKPRYLFYYGKECMYNGLWDDAEKAFKEYLPLSNWLPEKHRAMYELAVCYQRKGDSENCKRYAFEAIILDERYADPYILLTIEAYNRKDWKMCAAWASMVPQLGKPETFFFDYIPYNTYVPWDYVAVASWHFDQERGREAIEKCLHYKPYETRFLYNWGQFHTNDPKIAIVIPTYDRIARLLTCLEKIKANTFILNYEVLVGVDGNKPYYDALIEKFKDDPKVKIKLFEQKVGVPTIVETLVDETDATYITYIGDDVEVKPGWLIYAYKACQNKNLVCYNDNVWKGEIACHWFAPKSLREKLGGFFFYKGYKHVGCDNELTDKAKKLGCYVYEEKAMIDHVHYIKNICSDKNKVAEQDATYKIGWDEESVRESRELLNIRKQNNYLADTPVLKINIGAGTTKRDGYLSLDKYQKADIQKDIFEPNLFNNESVDAFLVEHVLEHFTTQEAFIFMNICFNALKNGGILEVSVPDFERISEIKDEEYKTKVVYGWQIDGMRHKWGYTPKTLVDLFKKHKLDIVSVENTFEYDAPAIRVIGKKTS